MEVTLPNRASDPGGRLTSALRLELGRLTLVLECDTAAEAIAVIGPSGSGKSTVLRLLAGLERRSTGLLTFRGETWQESSSRTFLPPWQRRVGWVPQDSVLFPHADVEGNLGWTGACDAEIEEVADVLEIAPLLDRRSRNLSGGERQRVALGRAILARPKLLLLDEPFAAVERRLRSRLAAEIRQLCRTRRLPLVLVSHDETDVRILADEVYELREGRLEPV